MMSAVTVFIMLCLSNKRSISPVSRLGRITHTTELRFCKLHENSIHVSPTARGRLESGIANT
jgi:hypothetical protein